MGDIRRLLLRNGHALDFWQRLDVQRFLDQYPMRGDTLVVLVR